MSELNLTDLLTVHNVLRNKGQKYIGFTYDISSCSRLFNGNNHPSLRLLDIGRRWNKSNWIIPINQLHLVLELSERINAENSALETDENSLRFGRPYIPEDCQNSADIVIYDDCMETTIQRKAFNAFQSYVTQTHVSLMESMRTASDAINEAIEKFQKVCDNWQDLPLKDRKPMMIRMRDRINQAIRIAENRLEQAIANSQLFDDTGKLTDLFNAEKIAIDAEKMAIRLKWHFVNLTPAEMI